MSKPPGFEEAVTKALVSLGEMRIAGGLPDELVHEVDSLRNALMQELDRYLQHKNKNEPQ